MPDKYDTIGRGYTGPRQPDPRIAAVISAALGNAHRIVNVGAGSGSYEPAGRDLVAVEPSAEMIGQRPPGAYRAVQASAEALPFADNSFDAAMAVLTVHHWADQAQGLRELRRVSSGPVVLVTFDPGHRGNWLDDYIPALRQLDAGQMPPLDLYARWLGAIDVSPLMIPHDCRDGFLYAYWRRPECYLDPQLRAAISSFHALGGCEGELALLAQEFSSGVWGKKYGAVKAHDAMDMGYRLVVARG
jgi:SAM-dependent methyltransferase